MTRLAKIRSKITAKEAKAIAQDSLYKLGFTEKQLNLIGSPSVHQYKFEESNGKQYPLPMFNVGWKIKELLRSQPGKGQYGVQLEVSGITKRVVEYSIVFPPPPRDPLSMDQYFQMLGLPTNYLQTLSWRERFRIGLPPFTNSPSQTTNGAK